MDYSRDILLKLHAVLFPTKYKRHQVTEANQWLRDLIKPYFDRERL